MRKALVGGLKILVPLALGLWLVVFFYRQLDERQRNDLFTAFLQADHWWLVLSIVLGLASHLSRAWRWRYLLGPLGHEVGFWSAYHSTMAGYFVNMLLPRAGEATRAVLLRRAEGVPFEKGFGTILAERVVDMIMLLLITATTLFLQLDKLDLFRSKIDAFRASSSASMDAPDGGSGWLPWVLIVLVPALVIGAWLALRNSAIRMRLRTTFSGFMEGVGSVLRTPDRTAFVGHTILIWVLYVAMFQVGFHAIPTTSVVPFAGVMAGFIAGSIGIILVQGGIGAYPAFVALIVGIYMAPPDGGGLIRPDALAMGWLLWTAQTVMIIVLGGLSLLLISRSEKRPVTDRP